ncbi:MAG: TMEM165/GDT1 family protein [Polyangiaceae bacterium]|jgi:putative Ca2+/H+ antiporter (TMEM165/GDT1 family)
MPVHGWNLFVSVFVVIFVAELPDKTALAALVLATRHRALPVLLGSCAALSIQSLVAVAAGQLVSLLPQRPVHIAAGVLFLLSAVVMWRRRDEGTEDGKEATGRQGFWRSTWLAFVIVFVAEWGDLTQLATAAFAARYDSPYVVFAAATAALWSVTALATVIGNRAGKLLDPEKTKKVAAVLFALVGAALIAGLL